MSIITITGPAAEPITVADVKSDLRIDGNDSDSIIASLIIQAREYCEDYQKKKYVTQTLEMVLDRFPNEDFIEFTAVSPVQSITSIKYTDSSGTEHTLSTTVYALDKDSFVNKVYLKSGQTFPTDELQPYNAVRIRFVAGYGTAANVPESVKGAMLMHTRLLYDINRYSEHEIKRLQEVRDSLLSSRRVIVI